jgi:hypothetical protein
MADLVAFCDAVLSPCFVGGVSAQWTLREHIYRLCVHTIVLGCSGLGQVGRVVIFDMCRTTYKNWRRIHKPESRDCKDCVGENAKPVWACFGLVDVERDCDRDLIRLKGTSCTLDDGVLSE